MRTLDNISVRLRQEEQTFWCKMLFTIFAKYKSNISCAATEIFDYSSKVVNAAFYLIWKWYNCPLLYKCIN